MLAVRHFFKRATEQVEAAIARTRTPARRVTRYLEAVAEALRPASRAFRDDVAAVPPGGGDLRAEHRQPPPAGSAS